MLSTVWTLGHNQGEEHNRINYTHFPGMLHEVNGLDTLGLRWANKCAGLCFPTLYTPPTQLPYVPPRLSITLLECRHLWPHFQTRTQTLTEKLYTCRGH